LKQVVLATPETTEGLSSANHAMYKTHRAAAGFEIRLEFEDLVIRRGG
jgi:hypothetical protein